MPETRLHIGDRIRLVNHHLTYSVGTEGSITQVYHFSADACRVRFDGHAADELVYRDAFIILILPPTKPSAT